MSSSTVGYVPRPGATPEQETAAFASVYRFVLDCHASKRDRLPDKSGPDDAKGSMNARAAQKYTG